jgi:hypothetical protein
VAPEILVPVTTPLVVCCGFEALPSRNNSASNLPGQSSPGRAGKKPVCYGTSLGDDKSGVDGWRWNGIAHLGVSQSVARTFSIQPRNCSAGCSLMEIFRNPAWLRDGQNTLSLQGERESRQSAQRASYEPPLAVSRES